jgi:periplasmic divalent cation tolerance protein
LEEISVVYSTFKTKDEAVVFSKKGLQEKLIACANVSSNILSLYNWQGSLCEEQECSAIFKLKSESLTLFLEFIKENHSYSVPSVLIFNAKTTPDFFNFCTK